MKELSTFVVIALAIAIGAIIQYGLPLLIIMLIIVIIACLI